AILGAWIGATLLGLGWNFEQVLTALVLPAALATAAVQVRLAQLQASVSLYKALGGGWQPPEG
ncbi:hypothetical protein R0G64_32405, partial [Pseudomonas otitidis]